MKLNSSSIADDNSFICYCRFFQIQFDFLVIDITSSFTAVQFTFQYYSFASGGEANVITLFIRSKLSSNSFYFTKILSYFLRISCLRLYSMKTSVAIEKTPSMRHPLAVLIKFLQNRQIIGKVRAIAKRFWREAEIKYFRIFGFPRVMIRKVPVQSYLKSKLSQLLQKKGRAIARYLPKVEVIAFVLAQGGQLKFVPVL